jgi:hypothetical protein
MPRVRELRIGVRYWQTRYLDCKPLERAVA